MPEISFVEINFISCPKFSGDTGELFKSRLFFFNTDSSVSQIPFLDFTNLALISKVFIFIWTIFISIGIWRAAENYKGSIIWIVLTFIIVTYRCYSLRLIFFI